jgi:hypothetical protein
MRAYFNRAFLVQAVITVTWMIPVPERAYQNTTQLMCRSDIIFLGIGRERCCGRSDAEFYGDD